MLRVSQAFIIIFIENLLKYNILPIVMHDKSMKEWFFKPCVHTLKEYILYLVICQSQNCKTFLHSAAVALFSKKSKKICFGHEQGKAMNKASPTNSIINLRHTFYVIVDAKVLCSILYSSGNIQIKRCWGTRLH